MNRKILKRQALEQLKGNWTPFVLASLIFSAISFIFEMPFLRNYFRAISRLGSVTSIENYYYNLGYIFGSSFLFLLVLGAIVAPMFTLACAKLAKSYVENHNVENAEKITLNTFFSHLKKSGRGIGNFWWTWLWLVLWEFAVLIPGIILLAIITFISHSVSASYFLAAILYIAVLVVVINRSIAYSMNWFILAKDPSVSVFDAMKISKNITNGQKGDLFILDLSFLGWAILSVFTLGIGYLWLLPYMQTTKYNALLYLIQDYNKRTSNPIFVTDSADASNQATFTSATDSKLDENNPYFANDINSSSKKDEE